MATFSWFGTDNDGLFSNPDNWGPAGAPAGPPGPSDDATIISGTVTIDQPTIEVGSLTVESSTIDDNGHGLVVDGLLDFSPFGAAAYLTVEGGEVDFGELDLNSSPLNSGSVGIVLQDGTLSGGQLNIAAGAFIQGSGQLVSSGGGATVTNDGIIEAEDIAGNAIAPVHLNVLANVITNDPRGIFRADTRATLEIGNAAVPLDADHVFTNLQDLGNGTNALVDGAYVASVGNINISGFDTAGATLGPVTTLSALVTLAGDNGLDSGDLRVNGNAIETSLTTITPSAVTGEGDLVLMNSFTEWQNIIDIHGLASGEPTSFTLADGTTWQGGGLYLDQGSLDGPGLVIEAADPTDPGSRPAFISGNGNVNPATVMNGVVHATATASDDLLEFVRSVSGSGQYFIDTNPNADPTGGVHESVLQFDTSLIDTGGGNTVTFDDAGFGAVLRLGMRDVTHNFQATIDDFGPRDAITLINVHATSATFDDTSNVLSVFDAWHDLLATLQLDDTIPNGQTFAVSSFGFTDGGSTIKWSDPNFAPVLTGSAGATITEDTTPPVETHADSLQFHDADPAATYLDALKIESDQALGSLGVSGGPLVLNATASVSGGINPLGLTYKVSDSAIDFLQAGETRTETFQVELTDGASEDEASATHSYTVTLQGTNDAPLIGNIDLPSGEMANFSLAGDASPANETAQPDDYVGFAGTNIYDLVSPSAVQPGQIFPRDVGAVWHPIDISQDFTVHARLFFGAGVFNAFNSGSGPGITFALQNTDAHAVGGDGGSGLGVGNSETPGSLSHAVGVKFDTYSDPQFSEPSANFAQFFANGDDETQLAGNPDQRAIGDVADGSWHDLVVSWDATTHQLTYTLDGTVTDTLHRDLASTDFGGATQVFAGFTGSIYPVYGPEQVEIVSVSNGTQLARDPNAYSVALQAGAAGTLTAADNTIDFSDPDQRDTHTVTVSPGTIVSAPTGYAGGIVGQWVQDGFTDTVNGLNGSVTGHFAVAASDLAFLQPGQQLVETFNVGIDDGYGGVTTQAITVTINGSTTTTDTAPVAMDDNFIVAADQASALAVLGNDTDANGDLLTAHPVTGPEHGALLFTLNNALVYRPDAGFHGIDTFTYVANDGELDSNVATVTVRVDASPVVQMPPTFVVDQGMASPLAGMSVSDADAKPGEIFTVDLSVSPTGTLSDSAPGASSPTLQSLHLVGTIEQVNAELAGVSYTGTADGAVQLSALAHDGSVGSSSTSATINPRPVISGSDLTVASLTSFDLGTGIAISDADAAAANEVLKVTLTASASNGVVTNGFDLTNPLEFSGTVDQVNQVLNGLSSIDTFNLPGSENITVQVDDGNGGKATKTINVTFDANPVVTAPSTFVVDQGMPSPLAGMSVSDADAKPGEIFTVNLGLLSLTGALSDSASGASPVDPQHLQIIGTLDQVNTALGQVSYTGTQDGAVQLFATARDSGPGIGSAFADINPRPVISGSDLTVASLTSFDLGTGIAISDADAAAANEVLKVTLTASASNGVVTNGFDLTNPLEFSGTVDQVNQVLNGLSSIDTFNLPGSENITVQVDDGNGGKATKTINVTFDANPVVTAPSTFVVDQGMPSPLAGMSVSDADAKPGEIFTVNLGLLSLTGALSDSASGASPVDPQHLQITGTLDQVNTALGQVSYIGTQDGAVQLFATARDSGPGIGSAFADINPRPVISGSDLTVASLTSFDLGTGIAISDADAAAANEVLKVTLTASASNGVVTNGFDLTNPLEFSGTVDQVNQVLNGLSSIDTFNLPGSENITVQVDDGNGGKATKTINVTFDANPVVTAPSTFVVDQGMPSPLAGMSVSDADAKPGEIFTVNLGLLSLTGALSDSASGASPVDPQHLQITGTLDQVNTALGQVSYIGTQDGAVQLFATARDSGPGIGSAFADINPRPVISGPSELTLASGSLVKLPIGSGFGHGSGLGIAITDADAAAANETLTVTLSATQGDFGTPGVHIATLSGSLTQIRGALNQTIYESASDQPRSDAITVKVDDGNGGVATKTVNLEFDTAPVANDDSYLVAPNATDAFPGNLLANDTDANGDHLTAKLTAGPTHGTLTQLNADGSFVYEPNAGFHGTDSFTYVANDGLLDSNIATVTLNVDFPPVLQLTNTQLAEQQGVAAPIPAITVTDADSRGETFTVEVSDTSGRLSVTGASNGGATVTGQGTTDLTIKGTLAQINFELGRLGVLNNAFGTDTIDVTVNDGRGGSDHQTIALDINAPVVTTVPGTQHLQLGVPTKLSGFSVADADAVSGGETITVGLADTHGLLSATAVAGLSTGTGAIVTGSGTTHLTLTGSLAGVNAALATLILQENSAGTDTISITSRDGNGSSDTHQIGVTTNAPPVLHLASTQLLVQQQQASAIPGITLTDADSNGETFTLVVSDTSGRLTVTGSSNGGATVSGAGTTQLTIVGTLGQVTADLGRLSILEHGFGTDTIDLAVSDSRGGSDHQQIAVTSNAPVVTTVPGMQHLQLGVAAGLPGISVADADAVSANETVAVVLSDNRGLLSATGPGVLGSGTTHLTILGSLAQVNVDLATLTLQENSAGTDTITVTASDGRGSSDTHQIAVAAVNAAPVLHLTNTEIALQQGVTKSIAGIMLTDADSATETFSLVMSDTSGLLSATAGTGATVTGSGTANLTITGTIGQVGTALQSLTYIDSAFGTDTIDITVGDGRGGSDHRQIAVDSNDVMPNGKLVQQGVMTTLPGIHFADADPNETMTATLSYVAGLLFATGATVSGSGTHTLTLSGSLAGVNSDIATLSVQANSDGSRIKVDTLDGDGAVGSYVIPINVNDPPILHLTSAELAVQQGVSTKLGVGFTDNDGSSHAELFGFSLSDTSGLFSATANGGLATVQGSGTTHLTITGKINDVGTALQSLTYIDSAFGTDTIDITVGDGRGGSDHRQIAVDSNDVMPNGKLVQQGVMTTLPGIHFADADPNETMTATLSYVAGLLFATGATVSGSGTHTLTLSGSLAGVNSDIATLSVQANSDGSRIKVDTLDGDGAVGSYVIPINVNDPPILHLTSAELAVQQGVSTKLGVGFTDNDGSSHAELFGFSLSDTSGLFSATANGGLATVQGSGTTHLTITGKINDVGTALQSLTYIDSAFGTDTIDITVGDGRGGSDHRQIAVDSNDVMPNGKLVQQGVMTTLPGIHFADADPNETMTATLSYVAGLLFATGATVSGSGTHTLTLSGSLAGVNSDIATLSVQANSDGSRIKVDTLDGDGAVGSYVIPINVNDPPILHLTSAELAVQQGVSTKLGVGFTDNDGSSHAELFGFSLSDTSGLFSATANGGLATVQGSGTTHLTITGKINDVGTALQSLTYIDSAFGTDTIDITVGDGRGGSDHRQIAVDSNAPPVTTVFGPQLVELGVNTKLPGISIADADAVSTDETVTVTLSDTAGLLSATGTGVSGSGTTKLTISGALAQVNDELATLSLQENSLASDTIAVTTSDGRGGSDTHQISVGVILPQLAITDQGTPRVSDTFVFPADFGLGVVNGFDPGSARHDVIELDHALLNGTKPGDSGAAALAAVLEHSLQLGHDLYIIADTHDVIELTNTSAQNLTTHDFFIT